MYQGVLAVGKIPEDSSLESICEKEGPLLLVAIEGVSSAENIGLFVRNAAAFGAQALVVGNTCATPYLRRAVRSSMGTVFQLPICRPATLTDGLIELRSRGVRCIAAHPGGDQKWLHQADLTGSCCLVFGAEGEGISPAVLAACQEAVAIPMAGGVDSLNVGSAAAAFLFEAFRQRTSRSPGNA
jgi:tRNA G18 (ribose-2'-O)-methylase SpoU